MIDNVRVNSGCWEAALWFMTDAIYLLNCTNQLDANAVRKL